MTPPAAGRAGITYEQVAAAADALTSRGERPSLRRVRAELGDTGSMGTIQKFLADWQASRRQVVQAETTLPTEVQRVILSEIDRHVSTARAELETVLAESREAAEALADDNEQQAEQINELETALDGLQAISQQQAGQIEQLKADLTAAQDVTGRERDAAEQARQALARAELKLESLPQLEAGLTAARADLDKTRAELVAAEKRAAVSDAQKIAAEQAAEELRARLVAAEKREGQVRDDLAKRDAEHNQTRDKLTEAVGNLAAARQEATELRAQLAELKASKPAPAAKKPAAKGEPKGE